MAIEPQELESFLKIKFPEAEIDLSDMVGDNDHYQLYIKTPEFTGKSRIEQHRMVMDVLKEKLASNLHAITIKTAAK